MEASADLIEALKIELEEFRQAANSFGLKPLPGETAESASLQLNTATKSVGSTVAQLLTAANEGNEICLCFVYIYLKIFYKIQFCVV